MKKREVRFEMRLSEEENAALEKLAKEKGVSKADVLRLLFLEDERDMRAVQLYTPEEAAKLPPSTHVCNVVGCDLEVFRRLVSSGIKRFNVGSICEKHWHELYRLIAMDQYYDLKEPPA